MARRSRSNRALPSRDIKAFNDALLLLPKKKKHGSRKKPASSNSGGTGFVVGEVTDDSVPANGCLGDDYGGLSHHVDTGLSYPYVVPPYEGGNGEVTDDSVPANGFPGDDDGGLSQDIDAGPSYPYGSPPDEGGNAQGNYALHAQQGASSGAENDAAQYEPRYGDAVDALAQYFDPDTLADGRLDADNFQGYIVPGEGYTVVCGVFRQPPSGEEQPPSGEEQPPSGRRAVSRLEQGTGDAIGDHGAYEV
jgi:hypothetical protein